MEKETVITIGITLGSMIGGVVAVGFGIYAFIGFLSWIFNDPFNWVQDTPITQYVEPLDFQLCRDSGGIPVKSGWTGNLKRCDPTPKITK